MECKASAVPIHRQEDKPKGTKLECPDGRFSRGFKWLPYKNISISRNRESPAKRDLRFAPTSFRTPKTFFPTPYKGLDSIAQRRKIVSSAYQR